MAALSGSTEEKVYKAESWLFVGMNWTLLSQSAEAGTSTLRFQVYLRTGAGSVSTAIKRTITLTVDGEEYKTSADLTIGQNSTKILFEKDVPVEHTFSNTGKTEYTSYFKAVATVPINIMTSSLVWVEEGSVATGTIALPKIKIPSTFEITGSGEMGTAHKITITRNNSSFTHTLKYAVAGTSGQVSTNIGTSIQWTPPSSLAKGMPAATSATCTLTLETYLGSELIGTNARSFKMYVPKDAVPTVSDFTLAEAVDGLAEQFGAFVSTKSKIAFEVEASGALGSTISTYQVIIAGQTFSKASGTTPVISLGGGTKTATVTVTDSRGRTASKSVDFKVIDYAPPSVYDFSVHRCDPDGVYNEQGECLAIALEFLATSAGGKNPLSYAISYKLLDADVEEYAALPFAFTGSEFNGQIQYTEPTFSADHTYNIRVQLTDYFGTVTKVLMLSSSRPVFDIMYSGAGFAFNKMAEVPDLLDIGYKTRFFGGIEPMVLQEGADLDAVTTTGYYVSVNMATKDYLNCPIEGGTFSLEVQGAGAESQLMQRLTSTSKDTPQVFIRHYYNSAWGSWIATYGHEAKVLWSGTAKWMNADQTVPLSEPISRQPSGIILVFTYYENGAKNTEWNHVFVSKQSAQYAEGELRPFMMATGDGSIGVKQLYISDQYIEGHAKNSQNFDGASGLKIFNAKFALVAVLGV